MNAYHTKTLELFFLFQDAIQTLSSRLNLSKDIKELEFNTYQGKRESELTLSICRNLAVVLACLADKLAGE